MIDQLSCMLWNCRGASNKAFFLMCNVYVKEKRHDILIIM